ncbi:MAG: peptidylprolyl isomerase [Desulfobacterales bacterium]|nr:peptidylprolyl isomerase [Desulfobacterales bacterium]
MQSTMTRWASMLFIILVAMGGSAYAQDQATPPPPVATVNGVAISQQDFDFEFQQTIGQMAQQGQMVGEENLPMVRQSVLGRMIEEELLFQDTQTQGINIPDQRVTDELARVKTRFPSEAEFQTTLAALKITEADLKRKIQRSLAIQQLISNIVLDVQVSEDEMQAFYDGNPSLFQSPEQVQARHILIKVAPEADEARKKEARQKIKDLQKKIKAGEDFAALAQAHSEGPSSVKGGDLGLFRRGQMVKPFEEAAFGLQKGEVSDVVETRFGYHLIKVTDRRPAGIISYEEAKGRIADNIKKEKDGKVVREYIEKLRAKAEIVPQPVGMPTAKPATGG